MNTDLYGEILKIYRNSRML